MVLNSKGVPINILQPVLAISMPSFPEFDPAREMDPDALLRSGAPGESGRQSLRRWLLDHVYVPSVEHFIDTDAEPFVPFGWSIEAHHAQGLMRWNPDDVALWLSERQQTGGTASGKAVYAQLKDQPVLNAAVLDYLFDHPELIPPDWEGRFVFFWGTVYRCRSGLAVRALILKDGILNACARRLDQPWGPVAPAAILHST